MEVKPEERTERDSVILAEQIRTIDKSRLQRKSGCADEEVMLRVDEAIEISLGLTEL